MAIRFTQPVQKNNYYLSRASHNVLYSIPDITIKRCSKLQNGKGYTLSIYLSANDQQFFNDIDTTALDTLIQNNELWFKNGLTTDDITELYMSSYCHQNNTIDLFLPIDTARIYLDDILQETQEAMNIIHQPSYTLSVEIQLMGLYIYSHKTVIKWAVKRLKIYQLDDPLVDSRDEVEAFWKEQIDSANTTIDNKIMLLQEKKQELNTLYHSIVTEKKHKVWDTKLLELKNMIRYISQ